MLVNFIRNEKGYKIINWRFFIFWLAISIIGAATILSGVKLQ